MDLLIQLLIGIMPAIISGLVAYYKAKKNAEVELKKMKHEAEREIQRIQEESKRRIEELYNEREADLEYYKGKLEADSKKEQDEYVNKHTDKFMDKLFGDIEKDWNN